VVKGWGDAALARAAENALGKIEAVLPTRCELRDGFRNLRLGRIADIQVTETRVPRTPGRTLGDLFAYDQSLTSTGDPGA
jgi:predicted DNA-binding transcriptional regulator YafY